MKLRKLQSKDASLMMEWMHDDSVVKDLKKDFASKTIDDCMEFIQSAREESDSIHLAIADDHDEYMGTVSLKHIRNKAAEAGMVLRNCAMGKGYASFALSSIIEQGFKRYGLHHIYWCTDPRNKRAIRFFEKNNYQRCDVPEMAQGYTDEEKQVNLWYERKL